MLNKTTLVPVTNISNSEVIYNLPEIHVRRSFMPNDTKQISVGELRALEYSPGGAVMIRNYLSVQNEDFLAELGITPEPEYFWTADDVKEMLETGSLEQLQDALDFAPQGIKELIQEVSVAIELNDMSKRKAILDATGFNVTSAIELLKDEEEVVEEKPAGRRVQPAAEGEKTRRATPPAPKQYKVVE